MLNDVREKKLRNGIVFLIKWWCFICSVVDYWGYDRFIFMFFFVSFKYIRFMGRYVCGRSFNIGSSLGSLYYVVKMGFEGVLVENCFFGGGEE